MRISDWSSDVCSSDLRVNAPPPISSTDDRISPMARDEWNGPSPGHPGPTAAIAGTATPFRHLTAARMKRVSALPLRSEEHTSELQSLLRIASALLCLKTRYNTSLYCSNPNHYTHS